ncbi:barstar family protein [Streptomyces sp. NBC_00820]|uniref:barstar family protein n=1 Tax=Streptomyces sp. NBC_00820 TaxID=2975842 RepID=UPI002ED47F44|nr:barstar family protein [Streptomyces sp. NBC_00820]
MRFTDGLDVVTPSGIREVLDEASRRGFALYVLDTDGRADRESFFHAVRETLPLDPPLTSSRSWDALADSLWEGLRTETSGSSRVVVVWRDVVTPDGAAEEDFRTALEVLGDVAGSLADPGITGGAPKHVPVRVAVGPRHGSTATATATAEDTGDRVYPRPA